MRGLFRNYQAKLLSIHLRRVFFPDKFDSEDHKDDSKKHLVVIFLQGWTNWIHVIRFHGLSNICCILTESPISRIIKKHYPFECSSYQDILKLLTNKAFRLKLILLEGIESFVLPWIQKLESDIPELYNQGEFILLAVFSTRVRRFKSIKWGFWDKIKHHCEAGGVTSNSYQIFISHQSQWRRRSQ